MEERLKQRLVGAAVLVSLGVMLAPMVLQRPSEPEGIIRGSNIPPRPDKVFSTRIEPISEAEILGQTAEPEISTGDAGKGPGPAEEAQAPMRASPARAAADVAAFSEVVPPPALSAWAVQIGSFAEAANALALRDRLRSKGYPAFVETVHVGNRKIMRVYVGPQLLRANAVESKKKLEKDVDLRGMIVRYPTS